MGIASGIKPPPTPSSSSIMSSGASGPEVISIISELFSPDGIPREKFDSLFLLCEGCSRVLPKVGQPNHGCVFAALSSDSELEEDVDNIVETWGEFV